MQNAPNISMPTRVSDLAALSMGVASMSALSLVLSNLLVSLLASLLLALLLLPPSAERSGCRTLR
jgi:hypothetical protein